MQQIKIPRKDSSNQSASEETPLHVSNERPHKQLTPLKEANGSESGPIEFCTLCSLKFIDRKGTIFKEDIICLVGIVFQMTVVEYTVFMIQVHILNKQKIIMIHCYNLQLMEVTKALVK